MMTTAFLSLLLACLLVMLVSLSGVVFIWNVLRRFLQRNLHYLVSFAAGVFLVVSFRMAERTVELTPSIWIAVIAIASGFLVVHIVRLIFPESHHHHEHECEECGREHSRAEAHRVLISDSFHNIADGLLLAPAFLTDIWLGVMATIGVVIHEMVQEISEFFVLREAGYSIRGALARNFAVSATILIGGVGGFYLASITTLVGILLGIAAGGFFYVVVIDLLPNSFSKANTIRGTGKFILAALIGVTLVALLSLLRPHQEGGPMGHGADNTLNNTEAPVSQ